MKKYKVIKRIILFFTVVIATIVFSIELQQFTPYLLANDDFSSMNTPQELHDAPPREEFMIEDQKEYIPEKKVDIRKMIKDTLRIEEEVFLHNLTVPLTGEPLKTAVLDITILIKNEKSLKEFNEMQETVLQDIHDILSAQGESDFSEYGIVRIKDEIIRKANSHFKQYVVTGVRFDKIEIKDKNNKQ